MFDYEVSTIASNHDENRPDFNRPKGIAIRENRNIIVVNTGKHNIIEIDSDYNITELANGDLRYVDPDYEYEANEIWPFPYGVTIRKNGNILFNSSNADTILELNQNNEVSLFAGTLNENGYKNGHVSESLFNIPHFMAIKDDETIIISDIGNNVIRGISPDGIVYTIAGDEDYNIRSVDEQVFNTPGGIAVSEDGIIISADSLNNVIRGIKPDGTIFIVAGTGEQGDKDGYSTEVNFNYPTGIAIGMDGIIIVADTRNHKIKGITPDGIVFTIAGTGGEGDLDGPGSESSFSYPYGIAVDKNGDIIVTDTGNNKIKRIKKIHQVKSAIDY